MRSSSSPTSRFFRSIECHCRDRAAHAFCIGLLDEGVVDLQVVTLGDQTEARLASGLSRRSSVPVLEADADHADGLAAHLGDHGLGAVDLGFIGFENRIEQELWTWASFARWRSARTSLAGRSRRRQSRAHEVGRDVDLEIRAQDLHHLLTIDAAGLGDVADLVGEGDLDGTPGVAGVLDHFGGRERYGMADARQSGVDFVQDLVGGFNDRAEDDETRIVIVLDCRAFAQEFG